MNMGLGKQNLKTSTGFEVNSHNLTFHFDNESTNWVNTEQRVDRAISAVFDFWAVV